MTRHEFHEALVSVNILSVTLAALKDVVSGLERTPGDREELLQLGRSSLAIMLRLISSSASIRNQARTSAHVVDAYTLIACTRRIS